MKKRFDRWSGMAAGYGLACGVAVTALLGAGRAQESIPAPPPACVEKAACEQAAAGQQGRATCELRRVVVNENGRLRVLISRLPAVGDVLKAACQDETGCEALLKRIGADFNVEFGEPQCGEERAGLLVLGCPVSAAAECACGSKCTCGKGAAVAVKVGKGNATCPGGACPAAACQETADHVAACQEAVCGEEHCPALAAKAKTGVPAHAMTELPPLKILCHVAGLIGERAKAQAALEARSKAHEEFTELYESMAQLMAANAALQARLEAHAEQVKLAEKLADLAAENARLKTHVELASERAEATRSALSLTLENERLKLRLAELEHKQSLEHAARSAQRPRADRKSR